jgi:hypothetical protein
MKAVKPPTTEDVSEMIKDLIPYLQDKELNKWESSFIENVITLVGTETPLTEFQSIKLKEIWNDYIFNA